VAQIDKAKLYDLVLTGLPVGFFLVDEKFRIIDFNPAAEKITGWKKEEVLGRPCSEVLVATGLCDTESPLREEVGEPGEYIERESNIRTRLGQEIPVHFAAASFFDEQGTYSGGLGIFSDASMARRVEADKKNLISMFTHDIKSPVAVVGGILIRILEGKTGNINEKQRHYLTLARNEIMKLDGYIHGFLDALRFEARQVPLYYTPCSIEQVLYEWVEANQISISEKEIHVAAEIPADLPLVEIDKNQIGRAFNNLLDNAIKYSPEKTLITIKVTDELEGILIEIRDQGYGIPPEDLPHIFDCFFRCKSQAKAVSGTGLGLAIVKGIVEAHGGRVWVKSKPAEGSSFFMTIPKRTPTLT
jgi:PAS domain S-box-containing protein